MNKDNKESWRFLEDRNPFFTIRKLHIFIYRIYDEGYPKYYLANNTQWIYVVYIGKSFWNCLKHGLCTFIKTKGFDSISYNPPVKKNPLEKINYRHISDIDKIVEL